MVFKTIEKIKAIPVSAVATLLVALALIFPCSCSDDLDSPGSNDTEGELHVSIAIASMGSGQTRADGDASESSLQESEGTADEYFIDLTDLYVMTFSIEENEKELTNDSKVLQVLWEGKKVYDDTRIHYNGNTAYLYTRLDTTISDYKQSKGFCLVAIANFSQFKAEGAEPVKFTRGMTFGDILNTLHYDFKPNTIIGGPTDPDWYWHPSREDATGKTISKGIPMFGVKKVSMADFDKSFYTSGNPYLLTDKPLQMLRAFSRVEIQLHDNLYNVKIESAKINDYASKFWVIPELDRMDNFATTVNYAGSGETADVNAIPGESYRASKSATARPMNFTISSDGKTALVYLPEYIIDNAQPPQITLNLDLGETTEKFEFALRKYDNATGDPAYWKYLLRNYTYKFKIGVDFNITVRPQPWTNAFDNEFTFGDGSNTQD